MKRLLLPLLFLGLISPVKANFDKEMSKQYHKTLNRNFKDLTEAVDNSDVERACFLLNEINTTLTAGWSYLRDYGWSYDALRKRREFVEDNYEQGCK
tara:strand:+ start:222 stop:512 length:291 start_codon:yes stop_codon:yes gene_type:complete